jgi:hypothetical protein
MKSFTKLLLALGLSGLAITGCQSLKQTESYRHGISEPGISLVPGDLTTIDSTDTIGNSRVTINSNDWLLANALSAVTGTNVVTFSGTNTWTGTNTFSDLVATNFTWDGITNYFDKRVSNTAAASTTNTFITMEATTADITTVDADTLYILETGTPAADRAGYGQFGVSNTIPNTPVFIADDGTITVLGAGGGGGGTVQDAELTIIPTDHGSATYTRALGTNSVDLQTVRAIGGSAATAQINRGLRCGLLGGQNSWIVEGVDSSVICGGDNNSMETAGIDDCFIGGGLNNQITDEGDQHVIVGGTGHTISGAGNQSTIGGGSGNTISGGTIETIAGGSANSITGGSFSFIGGGTGNDMLSAGTRNVIVGGDNNDVDSGERNAICGGEDNSIAGSWSFIGGGQGNDIGDASTFHSSILGGLFNDILNTTGVGNTILGGQNNAIGAFASCSYNMLWGDDVDITAASVLHSVGFGHDIDIAHNGCFVWKDNEAGSFSTAAADTFILQSAGGMGVNTNNPSEILHVNGNLMCEGYRRDGVAAGQTADVGSAQGGLPITTGIIEISTVGTIGDSTTLPTAAAGIIVRIINNGANACDVFPASGDNAGAGVDTAVSLAAGANITYVAYDATNWETF